MRVLYSDGRRRGPRVIHGRSDRLPAVAAACPCRDLSGDGHPDVVPFAFEFDGTYFWVGSSGPSVVGTRKFRNVQQTKVRALVDATRCANFELLAEGPARPVRLPENSASSGRR